MTRVLVFSDAQLDARSPLHPDRLADQEHSLERIAADTVEKDIDAVVFAGDLFQHRRPIPAELLVAHRFVETMRLFNRRLILVPGNHDWIGADQPMAIDLFNHDTAILTRTPQAFQLDDLAVAVLPWAPAASVLAARNDMPRDTVDQAVAERLVTVAEGLAVEAGQGPKLLVAHWMLSGSAFPSGMPIAEAREPILSTEDLVAQGWDWIVGGHVHKPQVLTGVGDLTTHAMRGTTVVCGSPYVCDFGEATLDHGYWILDTDTGLEFVPLEDRRTFITIDIDLTDHTVDLTDILVSALGLPLTDAIVRARFTCTEEQLGQIDQDALRRHVETAGGRLHEIRPTVLRAARARAAGASEDLTPLDALELYLAAAQTPDATAAPMRDRTRDYLEALA